MQPSRELKAPAISLSVEAARLAWVELLQMMVCPEHSMAILAVWKMVRQKAGCSLAERWKPH